MNLKILFISISIASISLLSISISAQSTWQDATYSYCKNYVGKYKQPDFWDAFFAGTSETSEQMLNTITEIYDICLKLNRGVVNVGDANVELIKLINFLDGGYKAQMVRELKDDFVDYNIGMGKLLLIVLGGISTIVGIAVGIKSLRKN